MSPFGHHDREQQNAQQNPPQGQPYAGQVPAQMMGQPMQSPQPVGGAPMVLPQAAQSRLAHDREAGAARSSFLGVGDYLTLRQTGFEPIAGVVGLSVVHIGGVQVAGLNQASELGVYSNAITIGLVDAATRLQEEAGTLGADGVFLHEIDERSFGEEHEYAWSGTALRFVPNPGALRTASGLPFLFAHTTQVLYQMMRAGFAPVVHGYGVCVYHVPHRTMRQALGQTFQNAEVPVFTDAWYTAREIAIARLQAQMEQHGAQLVLNMKMSMAADAFGEHTAEFRLSGSGWRHVEGLQQAVPAIDLAPDALIERGLLVTGPAFSAGAAGVAHAPMQAPPQPVMQAPVPGTAGGPSA
jgi:uncharacterized protein YbjQ (UPF0145 family)